MGVDGEAVNHAVNSILKAREPIGWRLGLERMRRICSLLGMPQNRFASIHVVGTNGKTSVARMTAALLDAHGVPAGAYLSPHIDEWRERILVAGELIGDAAFTEALVRAEQAAEAADRAAGGEGPVTQFELVTAAAFVALAAARVKVGVIEAGLGGRLDATNVIPSRVTVLTSVGLDHTEWLGGTLAEIAAEKLAVLRDRTVLVRGDLAPEAEQVAEREASRHHARAVGPAPVDPVLAEGLPPYQRQNLGLALAAAAVIVGELRPDAVEAAVASLSIPGRGQVLDGDPPVILDAAHNADGARALAAALEELTGGSKVVCCTAVLEGKDADAIVAALAPRCERAVCTEIPEEAIAAGGRPGGRSIAASRLAELFAAKRIGAEAEAELERAVARGRELAGELGVPLLVTGSHFLIGSALASLRG
jgi:dihydrofolate synthase/folylpolyglutamate synthase